MTDSINGIVDAAVATVPDSLQLALLQKCQNQNTHSRGKNHQAQNRKRKLFHRLALLLLAFYNQKSFTINITTTPSTMTKA